MSRMRRSRSTARLAFNQHPSQQRHGFIATGVQRDCKPHAGRLLLLGEGTETLAIVCQPDCLTEPLQIVVGRRLQFSREFAQQLPHELDISSSHDDIQSGTRRLRIIQDTQHQSHDAGPWTDRHAIDHGRMRGAAGAL